MNKKPQRRFYLRHFRAISHAIASYEDLETLIHHIVEGTNRTFNAKGCGIMLLDEKENQLINIASYGISEEYLRKGPVLWVDSNQSVIITGKPVFVEDMRDDPRIQYPDAAAKEGFISMLSIPIRSREAIIGVLRIYFGQSQVIHKDDIDSLCVLTELLGLVIENNGLKNFLDQVKMALDSLPVRLFKGA